MRNCVFAVGMTLLVAGSVPAQPVSDSRFSVSVAAGMGAAASGTGGAIGASATMGLTPHLESQVDVTYADRGPGMEAWAFEGRLQIGLAPRSSRIVPHAVVGAGAYRARFDMGHPQMFGGTPGWMAGQPLGPFRGTPGQPGAAWPQHGSMWGSVNPPVGAMPYQIVARVPMFYAQRLGNVTVPANGRWPARTFTDPAAVFGGGLTFNATRAIYIRPEARMLMVFGGGDTYTVGFFGVGVGVRF